MWFIKFSYIQNCFVSSSHVFAVKLLIDFHVYFYQHFFTFEFQHCVGLHVVKRSTFVCTVDGFNLNVFFTFLHSTQAHLMCCFWTCWHGLPTDFCVNRFMLKFKVTKPSIVMGVIPLLYLFGRFFVHIFKVGFWGSLQSFTSQTSVSQTCLLVDQFWLWKITTDPHILAHINIVCLDGRYPKIKKLYLRNDFR